MAKAHEMARRQREISIAEFFEKNRHLLGFDNKRKALLTTVKEAVDNSADACEEAGVLPDIIVDINQLSDFKYSLVVEDNGPGIPKTHIPKVFAKLLYGSKFFKLSQSRGQQGIGISAAVLYSQLTTGKPAKITSRISADDPANYYELYIDVKNNMPKILKEETIGWKKNRGTKIELTFEAEYLKGMQSVDEYIRRTAIINPHISLTYTNPLAESFVYGRITETLPPHPRGIKPHPYGIEIGLLLRMLDATHARTLHSFLMSEFSRVGNTTANDICRNSSMLPEQKPREVSRDQAEKLIRGISNTRIIAPPTDCISPIGGELLEKGLRKEVEAEFYSSASRPASVYRGNPFVVEVGIAYGGKIPAESSITLMRFANRVPLLYQQGACAITDSLTGISWKPYGLQQSGGSMPQGPAIVVVHMASVWVPFTSEAKEAIAHYPEIMKEIKLALQECGRKLGIYVNRKFKAYQQLERANLFERYIPEIAESFSQLTSAKKEHLIAKLSGMLNKAEIQAQLEIKVPDESSEAKAGQKTEKGEKPAEADE